MVNLVTNCSKLPKVRLLPNWAISSTDICKNTALFCLKIVNSFCDAKASRNFLQKKKKKKKTSLNFLPKKKKKIKISATDFLSPVRLNKFLTNNFVTLMGL